MYNRRRFLTSSLGAGAALGVSGLVPAWAVSASEGNMGIPALTGTNFDLEVSKFKTRINGRVASAVGVNGSIPAPLIRFREGDDITLNVKNTLDVDTSIHWHGLLVPFQMDGVPGVTFPGIKPGETFTYKYAVPQNGTYWYHSHSGLQEQSGHYGPIIIDPKDADPVSYDREYVLMLGDWTFTDPHRIFAKLKKNAESLNFNQATVSNPKGLLGMWGAMRMSPNDLADVTGETYTYVINGHSTADNFDMVFNPGERVRLRIINAAAMTLFNVRMPGLPMTVVQADGLNVRPVETDEFQMGVAEVYDVIVEPTEAKPFAFVAESIDRSGQVVATLAPKPGMRAKASALRAVPTLTMKDMGMDHSSMGGMDGMDHDATTDMNAKPSAQMDHSKMGHDMGAMSDGKMGGMDHAAPDHAAMGHGPNPNGPPVQLAKMEADIEVGPGVVNVAAMPTNRLDEPGIGLSDVPHRTLTYSQLRSLEPNQDTRKPGREVVVHLTSNMERYMWSFDGVKFSEVKESIKFMEGERVRLTMVNNTMMPHPIHLHGMFFDVVIPGYENGTHMPRKHTIVVKPGEKLSVDVTAEHVGDWAFHCHLIYHMHAGMMQVVSVLPNPQKMTPMMMKSMPADHSKMDHSKMGHDNMKEAK
ncbi:copper resistance system multicopper oxidase [Robiginitomaculum antarcticum]|uniref:copper resistance system multicopper oxidase n=1 Tax=Robiginitomaculum antarcticum TaxID=437507 RepID=UPI00036D6DBB|nr:copper resistance system multicopper oxidase [Robiginitomaculum antarcticum]